MKPQAIILSYTCRMKNMYHRQLQSSKVKHYSFLSAHFGVFWCLLASFGVFRRSVKATGEEEGIDPHVSSNACNWVTAGAYYAYWLPKAILQMMDPPFL